MSLHNRLLNKDQPLLIPRSKISSDHRPISHGSGGGGGSGSGGGNDENNKEEEKMQDALS
jgi:hypothetical protein